MGVLRVVLEGGFVNVNSGRVWLVVLRFGEIGGDGDGFVAGDFKGVWKFTTHKLAYANQQFSAVLTAPHSQKNLIFRCSVGVV